jgi:hypothetical protein
VKSRDSPADNFFMLFVVFLLTVSYVAVVVRVLRSRSRRVVAAGPCLPDDDQPPASAVGWPPDGARFSDYVDEGFAALDAYLSGATPPEVA